MKSRNEQMKHVLFDVFVISEGKNMKTMQTLRISGCGFYSPGGYSLYSDDRDDRHIF